MIGLFLFGFGNGAWDVAMNVQGAFVERRLGRAIMPRFHAGFSVGTVAGALIGAVMVALHVPVTAHLLVVARAGRRSASRSPFAASCPTDATTGDDRPDRAGAAAPAARCAPGGSRGRC